MTEPQKSNMAFIIFQNTGKFKSDLKNWLHKPNIEQTLNNMKIHFLNALHDIRNVDDVPISETFDQANMIQEVLEGVRNIVRNQVAEELPTFRPPQYPPIYDPPSQNQEKATEMNFPPNQQANAINSIPYAFSYAIDQQQTSFTSQQGAQMHFLTPPSHQQQTGIQKVQMPYQANTSGFANFTANRRGRGRNTQERGRGRGGRSQYGNQYQQQLANQNQFANPSTVHEPTTVHKFKSICNPAVIYNPTTVTT